MSYIKNLTLETRTCGQADEDARLDRRDGLTSAPRRYRSTGYQFSRRTREEWAALESEASKQARERARRIADRIRAGMDRNEAIAMEAK